MLLMATTLEGNFALQLLFIVTVMPVIQVLAVFPLL